MARASIIDPILLAAAKEAGGQGVTIAEVAERVWNETGGARGTRGVETQARKLVESGQLVRVYRYYYPVTADGVKMKSPVRRYRYLTPENEFFFDKRQVFDPE